MRELRALAPDRFIDTRDLFKSAEDIEAMTYPYLTDDRLFVRSGNDLGGGVAINDCPAFSITQGLPAGVPVEKR